MTKQQELERIDRSALDELFDEVPSLTPEESKEAPEPDRRDHERYEAEEPLTCDVRHIRSSERCADACEGEIENISRGGICLLTDHPIQEGSRLEVGIDLPDSEHVQGVLRVVRRSKRGPDEYEIGATIEQLHSSANVN